MRNWGWAVTAPLLLLGVVVGLGAGAAQAQYVNPYTGNSFNNAGSAMIDTMLLNARNRALMQNSLSSSQAHLAEQRRQQKLRDDKIRSDGAQRIKSGKATTRFAAAPFQVEPWIKRWKPKTAEDRKLMVDECEYQRQIWDSGVKHFGADVSDYGEAVALAFVTAYVVLSGDGSTNRQAFQWLADSFRTHYRRDAYFQGISAADKQYMLDTTFLGATDIMMNWHRVKDGKDDEAKGKVKDRARQFLAQYWTGDIDSLRAGPDKFSSGPATTKIP